MEVFSGPGNTPPLSKAHDGRLMEDNHMRGYGFIDLDISTLLPE